VVRIGVAGSLVSGRAGFLRWYDYRIGLSRLGSCAAVPPSRTGGYDCGGALAWMRERFPISGGIAFIGGLRHRRRAGPLGAGWRAHGLFGDYHPRYRLPMTALWHGLMPAITLMLGYFPARRLGLGEDIPGKIALQWASRRSPDLRPSGIGPGYARVQTLLDRCAALQRRDRIHKRRCFATEGGVRPAITTRACPARASRRRPMRGPPHRLLRCSGAVPAQRRARAGG
jgi:hypothetical protein